MPDLDKSYQELIITNFGLSPSGYTGSRGDVGYVGSGGLGYTGSAGSAGAGASVPTISAITYPGNDTAADVAGGQTITLTGTGFASGASVIINGVAASVVSFVNSTTITFTAPALSAGSYIVYVVNPNGTTALLVPGIQYSGTPVWSTAAGSLGNSVKNSNYTTTLVSTGDAPITYSLTSGTLPSGLTLNGNTGVLSGTSPNVTVDTTYNFTIRSTDAQQQDTDRAFSLTVSAGIPVDFLLVAGGGSGGSKQPGPGSSGGGGAGGMRTSVGTSGRNSAAESVLLIAPGVTYTITVGAGGVGNDTAGVSGSDSSISGSGLTTTAIGGGRGGHTYDNGVAPAASGGSGGGAPFQGTPGSGTANQGYGGGSAPNSGGYSAAGGGGAGAVGADSSGTSQTSNSGSGGGGISNSITGTAIYYAGGGGGGAFTTQSIGGGGTGGGGAGGNQNITPSNGAANTGGGGGGASYNTSQNGGAGGSGVVVIRYSDSYNAAASTTGSPTVTVAGGYRVYKFNSSGSITF